MSAVRVAELSCVRPLFTIGYEGRALEDFLDALIAQGVETLVDVRELPISRKKGFSKSALTSAVEARGISYVHIPQLGSPRRLRHRLKEDWDSDSFFREYSEYLATQQEAILMLSGLTGSARAASSIA